MVDVEVFGIPDEYLARLRALPSVDTVSVEDVDQRQIVRVQTTEGSASLPAILSALSDLRLGKVNVREPSLEDAYVRLVGGEA